MQPTPDRRAALAGFGVVLAGGAAAAALAQAAPSAQAAPLAPPGAAKLKDLAEQLARARGRRDYKTVPMILEDRQYWDHEAMAALLSYQGGPRQIWDNTELSGPWVNGMRNAMNVQIWSFKHPDFLLVSATHGPAQLSLLDQAMWDKYGLAKLAKPMGAPATNTFLDLDRAAEADRDPESEKGAYSTAGNTVAALMARGAVFMACHLALWEMSARLIKEGLNPDHLSHEQMAAELTNHLAPGVVLTPGMVATIPEFQQAGYHYMK